MDGLENHELDMPELVVIPEHGKVKVTAAIDTFGCVDPRKSVEDHPSHADGFARVPGGTKGFVMTLMGAVPELSPQQAVDYVFSWEIARGRTPTFHIADNVHGSGTGCGHEDNASKEEHEELYGLNAQEVRDMTAYVHQIISQGTIKTDVCMLTGPHAEVGVLEVLSDDVTVQATDDRGNAFFRFDKTRHDKEIKTLAEFLMEKGVKVDADALLASAEKQRNATLMLLAKGKPVYRIDLRKNRRQKNIVELVGYVGQQPLTPDPSTPA